MSGHWAIADMGVALEDVGPDVIQAPKLEPRIMRYELSDHEWVVIKSMLPNKPRGVPRVNDRRGPQRHLLGSAVRCTLA